MKRLEPAKEITAKDIAKMLGMEEAYNEALLEEELKRNEEIIMSDDFEDEKNNIKEDNDVNT